MTSGPHLLDTNVWIVALRTPTSRLASAVRLAAAHGTIVFSDVVKAELIYGAHLKPDPAAAIRELDRHFTVSPSHPFDLATARLYGDLAAQLHRSGKRIGPFDLAIAATALLHGCTVVTHNRKHFDLVPGLSVEDWEAEETA